MEAECTVLLRHFRQMLMIRRFEESIAELHQQKLVVGSVHLCNGQEAIPVGTCSALDLERDAVFPTYRGHGWTLACGVPAGVLFAELLGREGGLNGGRGGSAYHSAPDYGMYGENSIVGANTPIACGAALAAQFDGTGRVCVAVFGDGATNQGAVHEAMNFASIRRLPVVFLIENNRYSELTPISAMSRLDRLSGRASAYGITGIRIDGNDVEAVAETMRQVVNRVRSGDGPVVVEATTERIVGHYIGDAQQYRAPGEIDAALVNEPIVRAERLLIDRGMSRHDLDIAHAEAEQELNEAREWALSVPIADPSTAAEHLYA
jgi:TPP-dependent pyruvate/acetoin dehydrogenase alpha subunit